MYRERFSVKAHDPRLGVFIIYFQLLLIAFAPRICSNPVEVNDNDIKDAILQNRTEGLERLDINGNGRIDSADVVRFLRDAREVLPDEIPGFTWLVSASFTAVDNNGIPYNYLFALRVDRDASGNPQVVATKIPGFDPTVGIFAQKLSSAEQIPGQHRRTYLLSTTVPDGTSFDFAESGDGNTITFRTPNPIEIPASENPAGIPLAYRWTLELDKNSVLRKESAAQTDGLEHGTIAEEVVGFLPGDEPIIATGRVSMAPFVRTNLSPIEAP